MCKLRRVIVLLAATATLVVTPTTVQSQDQGSALTLGIVPKVGLLTPLSKLGPGALVEDGPIGTGENLLVFDRLRPAVTVGIALQVQSGASPWGARATVLYALPSDVPGHFECLPGVGCPDILVEVDAESSILAAVADVVYGPIRLASPIVPYGMVGLGIKTYRMKWPNGRSTTTHLAIHAGGGAEIDWRWLSMWLDVEDYISGFGPDEVNRGTKHDLAVTLGWRFVLF